MFFGNNIKLLRNRLGRTQHDVAFSLDMKRSTLSGYENGVAQPGLEALMAFSAYFKVSIDTLVKVDLAGLRESELSQIERGYDIFITGSQLRVLATTVNSDNIDNIELVNEKAKAGYQTGYADPEFIKVLPAFQMPFVDKDLKHRMFQISGDSMLPIPDKSYITGQYIEDWMYMRSNYPYIILTRDDGIVFKVVENKIKEGGIVTLYSLNPLYEPFDVLAKDIVEVWKFVNYVSREMPEPNLPKDELVRSVKSLQEQMRSIQTKLDFKDE